jgi:hypothetical protein
MAYNRIQAGRLLAAAELPVFEASLGESLAALTETKLRVLIKRARTMRDKAQDLLQRQRVATRGRTGSKGGISGAANERTAQKARALSEALARFENRLAQLEAAGEVPASAKPRAGKRLVAQKQRARAPGNRAAAGGAGKAALASAPEAKSNAADKPPSTGPTASRRATAKTVTRTSLKSAVKAAVVATQAAKEQTAGQAPARSAKAPATAPGNAGTGVPSGSSGAVAKGRLQQRKFTGSQAIQAHVGARGRRVQAKRDKR